MSKRKLSRDELINWHVKHRSSNLSETGARELAEKRTDRWLLEGYARGVSIGHSRTSITDGIVPNSSFRSPTRGFHRGASQSGYERGSRH